MSAYAQLYPHHGSAPWAWCPTVRVAAYEASKTRSEGQEFGSILRWAYGTKLPQPSCDRLFPGCATAYSTPKTGFIFRGRVNFLRLGAFRLTWKC